LQFGVPISHDGVILEGDDNNVIRSGRGQAATQLSRARNNANPPLDRKFRLLSNRPLTLVHGEARRFGSLAAKSPTT
jgi:hypothetical protein